MSKIARLKKAMKESKSIKAYMYGELPTNQVLTPAEMLQKLGGISKLTESSSLSSPQHLVMPDSQGHGGVAGSFGLGLRSHDISQPYSDQGHLQDPTQQEHLEHISPPEQGHLGSEQHVGEAHWSHEAAASATAAEQAQAKGDYQQAAQDWLTAGHDYNEAGNHDNAGLAYHKAAGSLSHIVNGGGGSEALYKEIASAYDHAGNSYMAAQNYSEAGHNFKCAASNYSDLVNIFHDNGDHVFEKIGLCYMNAGQAYKEGGYFDKAVNAFSDAASNYVHIGANLGAANAFLGEAEANVAGHYGWQTAVNFQNAAHYFRLAGCEPEKEAYAYEQAASYFNSEGGHVSEAAHCARLAGETYLQLKEYDSAETNFKLAIENYSGNPEMVAKCYDELGSCYQGQDQFKLAGEAFLKEAQTLQEQGATSAEQWSNLADAYENAGSNFSKSGDLSDAAQSYQSAIGAFQNAGDNNEAKGAANLAAKYYISMAEHSAGGDITSNLANANACWSQVQDWTDAVSSFEQAARSLESKGDYRQAGYAYSFVAQSQLNMGDNAGACSSYQKEANFYLSAAMSQDSGNTKEAKDDLRNADFAFGNAYNADTAQDPEVRGAAQAAFSNAMNQFSVHWNEQLYDLAGTYYRAWSGQ